MVGLSENAAHKRSRKIFVKVAKIVEYNIQYWQITIYFQIPGTLQ